MENLKTILIIDDETIIVSVLFTIIQGLGKIIFAKSIANASELITQRCPDLILLDNHLPDGYGIDLCKKLRASNNEQMKKVPIIMITGNSDKELEALEAGASDFISKPIDAKITRLRILKHL